MFISILFTVALLLTIILPVIGYFVGEQTKGRFKRTVIGNVVAFFGVFLLGYCNNFKWFRSYCCRSCNRSFMYW